MRHRWPQSKSAPTNSRSFSPTMQAGTSTRSGGSRSPRTIPPETEPASPNRAHREYGGDCTHRQGLNDQALHVYRRLRRRRPGDHRLEARIRELEALAGAGSEPASARWPAYAASVTGWRIGGIVLPFSRLPPGPAGLGGPGRSRRASLSADAAADDQAPGAPTRPARDAVVAQRDLRRGRSQPPPATPLRRLSASTPTTRPRFLLRSVLRWQGRRREQSQPRRGAPPAAPAWKKISTSSRTGSRVSRSNAHRRPERSESQSAGQPESRSCTEPTTLAELEAMVRDEADRLGVTR